MNKHPVLMRATTTVEGKKRQSCNSLCYNAKHDKCDCVCGGANHGVGLKQAITNTEQAKLNSHEGIEFVDNAIRFPDLFVTKPLRDDKGRYIKRN